MQSMGKYDKSLQIQLDRLDISTWIRSNITERNILPIFQPSHENVMDDVNALCTALEQIEHSTTEMAVVQRLLRERFKMFRLKYKSWLINWKLFKNVLGSSLNRLLSSARKVIPWNRFLVSWDA